MLSIRHKIGVWLALTALALQLGLSFGHVHIFGACNSRCGTAVTGTIAKISKIPVQAPNVGADQRSCCFNGYRGIVWVTNLYS
jgi:hypothetical protein